MSDDAAAGDGAGTAGDGPGTGGDGPGTGGDGTTSGREGDAGAEKTEGDAAGSVPDPAAAIPEPRLRDPLGLLALLPFVGYLLLPYGVALRVVGGLTFPVLAMGVPQLLLAVAWVGALRADRARLARASGWTPWRHWYVLGFLLGGTVLLAPVLAVVYVRWRRWRAGAPDRAWLGFALAVLPGGGDADSQPEDADA